MKKRRKKQPSKFSLVYNSSILLLNAKLKTQNCGSSTTGTILSMYDNKFPPLPRYNHHPMHSNASTTVCGFTSCPQASSEIYKHREQKHKLKCEIP